MSSRINSSTRFQTRSANSSRFTQGPAPKQQKEKNQGHGLIQTVNNSLQQPAKILHLSSCNRLWLENPNRARITFNCVTYDHAFSVYLPPIHPGRSQLVSEQLNADIVLALRYVKKYLVSHLNPLQENAWVLKPDQDQIKIEVLPFGVSLESYLSSPPGPTITVPDHDDVASLVYIDEKTQTLQMRILITHEAKAKGMAYLIAILAHEMIHLAFFLRGIHQEESNNYQEITAYKKSMEMLVAITNAIGAKEPTLKAELEAVILEEIKALEKFSGDPLILRYSTLEEIESMR